MTLIRSLCIASFLAVATVGLGCSGDDPDVVDNGKAISDVALTPGIDSLTKGSSLQFTAMVSYADGTSKDVTSDSDTVWNTSEPNIATVDKGGNVTAVSEGAVDITATYLGVRAEESFIVMP